jgi:hypothetical protein
MEVFGLVEQLYAFHNGYSKQKAKEKLQKKRSNFER